MAETLELEIATPARQVVRETVTDVQIPGKDGYLAFCPATPPCWDCWAPGRWPTPPEAPSGTWRFRAGSSR